MASSTPEKQLAFIVLLQTAAGFFELSGALAKTVFKSVEEVTAAVPPADEGADALLVGRLWATALALAVLTTRLDSLSGEWMVLAKKSRKWIRKNVAVLGVEGTNKAEKTAALEALAVAFL
jgi:hypothetical protein